MGKKRYLVEWTAWGPALAAAVRAGMPEDGEVSDYIELDDFDRSKVFPAFLPAVRFAKTIRPADAWNCPRIRRQFLALNDHDDLGNRVEAMPSWETEANWEAFEDAPDPVEAEPNWTEDAA